MTNTPAAVPHFWNDGLFRVLGMRAQLVYCFVASHPHLTLTGAVRATLPGLAAEMGWSLAVFRRAFSELEVTGLVRSAASAPLIWLPRWMARQNPPAPELLPQWSEVLQQMPECRERAEWLADVYHMVSQWGPACLAVLPPAFRVSSGRQSLPPAAVSADRPDPADGTASPDVEPSRGETSGENPDGQIPDGQIPDGQIPDGQISDRCQSAGVRSKSIPVEIPVPQSLQSERFLSVWSTWVEHCRARQPEFLEYFAEHLLRRFSKMGIARSVKIVEALLLQSEQLLDGPPSPATHGWLRGVAS